MYLENDGVNLSLIVKLIAMYIISVRNDININKTPNIKKFNAIFVLSSINAGINAAKNKYAFGFNNGISKGFCTLLFLFFLLIKPITPMYIK